jgi:hypothetical protein
MEQKRHFPLMRTMAVALAALTMLGSGRAAAYDIVNRWTSTQLDGGNLQRGDAVTLRWSIVPDGQSYPRSNNSQLVQFLDDGWNVPAAQRVPSFSGRPWWGVINQAYQQFGRVSGVTMVYIPEQNGAGVDTGFEGDIRIGGENLDGTPGGLSPTTPSPTPATCGSTRPAKPTGRSALTSALSRDCATWSFTKRDMASAWGTPSSSTIRPRPSWREG